MPAARGSHASHAENGHAQHTHQFVVPVAAMQSTRLPRTGWTATANSQETVQGEGAAATSLDGDTGTLWRPRKRRRPADPLPHILTIE